MARLLIITSEGGSLGFRLGGFESREVAKDADPTMVLEELERETRYALVCIDKHILERADKSLLTRLKKKGLPVVMPLDIPVAWEEDGAGESPVARMIRRAIGYQIKIRK